MKTPDITVATAIEVLDALGSASDPVFFRAGRSGWHETTISDLTAGRDLDKANTVYLAYHNAAGRQVRGTLAGMVLDRLGCRG